MKIRWAGELIEVSAARIVGTNNRHRTPALRRHNSVELPPSSQALRAGDLWNLIREYRGKAMPCVKIRWSTFGRQVVSILRECNSREVIVNPVRCIVERLRIGVPRKPGNAVPVA